MDTLRARRRLALLDSSPVAQADVTPAGTVASANPRLASMIGAPLASLPGRRVADFLRTADGPSLGAPETPPYGLPVRPGDVVLDLDHVSGAGPAASRWVDGLTGGPLWFAPPGVPRGCRLLRDDGTELAVLALTAPLDDDVEPDELDDAGAGSHGASGGTALVVVEDPDRSDALATVRQRARMFAAAESLMGLACWESDDVDAGPVVWSGGVQGLLGLSAGEPQPDEDAFLARMVEEDRTAYLAVAGPARSRGGRWDVEVRVRGFDGLERTLRTRGHVEPGRPGARRRAWGVITDLTGIRAAERETRNARDLFRRVLDAATEQIIVATDAAGAVTLFNAGAERALGYASAEVIGSRWDRLVDGDELRELAAEHGVPDGFSAFAALACAGSRRSLYLTFRTRDGGRRTVAVSATAIRDAGGTPTGYIGIGTDVTRQLHAERALRESEERFRLAFHGAPIGMAMLSASGPDVGALFRVNRALCRLVGRTEEQLLGQSLGAIMLADPDDARRGLHELLAAGAQRHQQEARFRHADGGEVEVLVSTSLVRGELDEPRYFVMQVEDITARKEAEQELSRRAMHDPLTGLPNRMLLLDHLKGALARADRQGTHVAVMFLDLDNFKDVNDSLGHDAGDDLLVDIAQRLRRCLRETDTAARLGGDEFVVVCEGLASPEEASKFAGRIEAALRVEIPAGDRSIAVTVSVGIATSRGRTTPAELLRDADGAMYRAKERGRARYEIADPAVQARALAQRELEAHLRDAPSLGQLALEYLPAFELASGRVVALEALVRWRHPTRGWLQPADFLPVAEERGLIDALGAWVLERACADAASWSQRDGGEGFEGTRAAPALWVNVSGKQLSGHLAARVEAALGGCGLDPGRLWIEVPERQATSPALADMARLGVRLALDGVGTGLSSPDSVERLPVAALKIGRRRVRGLGRSRTDAAMVQSLVTLSHGLGLTTVATGVESDAQRGTLLSMGCDLAQGFALRPPVAAAEVPALLGSATRRRARRSA